MKSIFSKGLLILLSLSSTTWARGVKEGGGDSAAFEVCVIEHFEKIQSELLRDDLIFDLSSDATILFVVTPAGDVVAHADISICHQ